MSQYLPSSTAAKLVAPRVLVALAALALLATPAWGEGQTLLVRGVVALPDGAPANGGVVSFAGRVQYGPVREGRFEFTAEAVTPGDYFIAYAKPHGGFLIARVVSVTADQHEVLVSLKAGEQPAVKGLVSTEDLPKGVPGAQIRLRGTSPQFDWVLNAGNDGSFVLDGLALRGVTMQAVVPHHRESAAVEIRPPFPMSVDLRAPNGTAVLGQVMDLSTGAPVPGAVVAWGTRGWYGSTLADEQGRFELTGLRAGAYRVEAYARFLSREEVLLDLQEGRTALGLVIALLPQDKVQAYGWVQGPDGDVAGARMSFRQWVHAPQAPGQSSGGSSGPGVPQIVYTTRSETDGKYGVELPAPPEPGTHGEPWQVEVEADGYLTGHYTGSIEDPEHPGPYVFRLSRGGRLTGTVSLPGGIPAGEHPLATISFPWGALGLEARPAAASSVAQVPVDPRTGRFDFGPIQPGTHQLTVSGHPELTTTVTVKEGETAEVTVAAPHEAAPGK
jgi:hypothetical protein